MASNLNERITYRIKGAYWQQEPLSYDDWCKLYDVLKGKGAEFGFAQGSLAKWLDAMIAENTLPRVVAIVLKPYEPTVWHRWCNRRAARRHGVTLENIGAIITSSPRFAGVVRDFFLLNVGWWESWLNTPLSSNISLRTMTPAQVLQAVTNTVGILAAVTSPKQAPSA